MNTGQLQPEECIQGCQMGLACLRAGDSCSAGSSPGTAMAAILGGVSLGSWLRPSEALTAVTTRCSLSSASCSLALQCSADAV